MWKERVSPTACGVLRWIIASNRSCIVPIEDDIEDETEKENLIKAIPGKEQGVWGMGDLKQFRFAMGAPDKEQRFVNAVKDAQERLKLTCTSSAMFFSSEIDLVLTIA
jgi:ubiquitin-conjugating enzyme E2 Q